jgi:hypothetical protein
MAGRVAEGGTMVSDAKDKAEIERVIQLYIDGARAGDVSKLREAFHEDARMFGSLGGHRYDVPIEELYAMSDGTPADVDGSYKARIVSVAQVEDAAVVTLEEEGYWGTVSFTDFFTLSSIKGEWKIVNKPFAHTGGEPPSH